MNYLEQRQLTVTLNIHNAKLVRHILAIQKLIVFEHKLNGPAVIYNSGHKEWWLENMPHRLDKPAVLTINGFKEWWVNGEFINESITR